MTDPAMVKNDDGVLVCFICGAPLGEIGVKHGDPFCTSKCCNEFYSVESTPPLKGGRHGPRVLS